MNYLQLCQETASKAAVSGSILTTVGQTGELLRICNWVREGYLLIQTAHDNWRFMRRNGFVPVQSGINTYTALSLGITDYGNWMPRDWRCYLTSIGLDDEQPIFGATYDGFRTNYGYSTQREQVGRPQVFTITPDESVLLWPIPDNEYHLNVQYFIEPARLVADTDEPIFARRFHFAIVYRALMLYAEWESDSNLFSSAQLEFNRLFYGMEEYYLPSPHAGEPMA
jgi:hypothetical protein